MPEVLAPPAPIPAAPKNLETKVGDKFGDILERVQKGVAEAPPKEEPKQVEPVKEPAKETAPPEDKKEPEKPSALEAALGEPKPDEAKPDELEEFDKIETPKSEHWKRAREVMKRQKDEISKLQSTPPTTDASVEAITKERDELRSRVEKLNTNLKAINAEYSEDFQALLSDREKALTKVANKMKYSGASEKVDDLVSALNMPEGKHKTMAVKEALAELDADDRISVRTLIERVDEVDDKITEFRKDLPGQWDKLQSQRERESMEHSEQSIKLLESEFHKVIDDLPKEIIRLRQVGEDVTGAKEWNEPIQKAVEGALSALKPNGADFKSTVTIAVKGGLFDHLWSDFVAQNKELKEARMRLKEFDSGAPDFKGGKKPDATTKTKRPFAEILAEVQGSSAGAP